MKDYQVVIGIEIHVELNTKTKMFSGAGYAFKNEANTLVNEIDLGMPGTLPSTNMEAVKKALKACLALNLNVDPLVKFDRKNYYYSDLPKGFQITQQFHPIGKDGYLFINPNGEKKKIRINRIHMEEDTAKQFHLHDQTLIDYNRAGVPLIEVVSEPDMRSGLEASLYVEKLRQTLLYIGVSECKMEEGSMRCDINVSINEVGSKEFGTKVEIKNLNSIANIKTAIDYEVEEQKKTLEAGEKVVQATKRFDEKTQTTVLMRKKEGTVDYKFFPEPNIFPIRIPDSLIEETKASLPELPDAKHDRYLNNYKLSEYDIQVITNNRAITKFFDEVMQTSKNAKTACNMIVSDLAGKLAKDNKVFEDLTMSPADLADLINTIDSGDISSKQGKEVLEEMYQTNKKPADIISEKGFKQESNVDLILSMVKEVLDENQQSIDDFKAGKDRALGYLVGQLMKKSKGQVNPGLASKYMKEELLKR